MANALDFFPHSRSSMPVSTHRGAHFLNLEGRSVSVITQAQSSQMPEPFKWLARKRVCHRKACQENVLPISRYSSRPSSCSHLVRASTDTETDAEDDIQIEGIDRAYCDDFVCTSSPQVCAIIDPPNMIPTTAVTHFKAMLLTIAHWPVLLLKSAFSNRLSRM